MTFILEINKGKELRGCFLLVIVFVLLIVVGAQGGLLRQDRRQHSLVGATGVDSLEPASVGPGAENELEGKGTGNDDSGESTRARISAVQETTNRTANRHGRHSVRQSKSDSKMG